MPPKPDKGEKKVAAGKQKDWQRMSTNDKDKLLYELAKKAGLVR